MSTLLQGTPSSSVDRLSSAFCCRENAAEHNDPRSGVHIIEFATYGQQPARHLMTSAAERAMECCSRWVSSDTRESAETHTNKRTIRTSSVVCGPARTLGRKKPCNQRTEKRWCSLVLGWRVLALVFQGLQADMRQTLTYRPLLEEGHNPKLAFDPRRRSIDCVRMQH